MFVIGIIFWGSGVFVYYKLNSKEDFLPPVQNQAQNMQQSKEKKSHTPSPKPIVVKPKSVQAPRKKVQIKKDKNPSKKQYKTPLKFIQLEQQVKQMLKNYNVPSLRLNFVVFSGEHQLNCEEEKQTGDWPGTMYYCQSLYQLEIYLKIYNKTVTFQGTTEANAADMGLAKKWAMENTSELLAKQMAPVIFPKKERTELDFLTKLNEQTLQWWLKVDNLEKRILK